MQQHGCLSEIPSSAKEARYKRKKRPCTLDLICEVQEQAKLLYGGGSLTNAYLWAGGFWLGGVMRRSSWDAGNILYLFCFYLCISLLPWVH